MEGREKGEHIAIFLFSSAVRTFRGCSHMVRAGTLIVDNLDLQWSIVRLKSEDDQVSQLKPFDVNKILGETKVSDDFDRLRTENLNLNVHKLVWGIFRTYKASNTELSKYICDLPEDVEAFGEWQDRMKGKYEGLLQALSPSSKWMGIVSEGEIREVKHHFDPPEATHIQTDSTGGTFERVFRQIYSKDEVTDEDPLWGLARGYYLSRSWHLFDLRAPSPDLNWQLIQERQRRAVWFRAYCCCRKGDLYLPANRDKMYRRFVIMTSLTTIRWCIVWYRRHFSGTGSDKPGKRAPERFVEMWVRHIDDMEVLKDWGDKYEIDETNWMVN